MNERVDLDSEVIEELEQGRKIGAIKILRIKRSMSLKDAKELVETYLEQNSYVKVKRLNNTFSPVVLLAIIFLAYALYRILFLSQ